VGAASAQSKIWGVLLKVYTGMIKIAITRRAVFSSKCTTNHLAAELRPDPLGELTALPSNPLAGLKQCDPWEGKRKDKRKKNENWGR